MPAQWKDCAGKKAGTALRDAVLNTSKKQEMLQVQSLQSKVLDQGRVFLTELVS